MRPASLRHWCPVQTDFCRLIVNYDESEYSDWKIESVYDYVSNEIYKKNYTDALKADNVCKEDLKLKIEEFSIQNAYKIFQKVAISKDAGKDKIGLKKSSQLQKGVILKLKDEDFYVLDGRQIYFYSNKVKISNEGKNPQPTRLLTNVWTDIPWNGIAKEGNVELKNGKKPEKLIYRLINITIRKDQEETVLDFFGGSGTTASVAYKMGQKFISCEMNDYFDSIVVHDLFEKIADYFSCLSSFGYLEIRRCIGWRFEHQINGITPDLIVTPWQVDQLNLTQADTVLHMQQVLSGALRFYNTLQ